MTPVMQWITRRSIRVGTMHTSIGACIEHQLFLNTENCALQGRWALRRGGQGLLLVSLLGCLRCIKADEVITEDSFSYPVLWDEESLIRRHVFYLDGRTNLTVGSAKLVLAASSTATASAEETV